LCRLTLNAGFDLYRLVVAVLEVKEWEGSARSHDKVDSGDGICVRVTVWGVTDLPPSLIFFQPYHKFYYSALGHAKRRAW